MVLPTDRISCELFCREVPTLGRYLPALVPFNYIQKKGGGNGSIGSPGISDSSLLELGTRCSLILRLEAVRSRRREFKLQVLQKRGVIVAFLL
jgi:hypothetical protein